MIHSALSAADVAAALSHLDPGCTYDEWIRIGMAVKHAGADAGDASETGGYFGAWDTWSRGCPEKYKPNDTLRKWRSFKTDRGITAGTLVHLASAAGWVDPRRQRRAQIMGWRGRSVPPRVASPDRVESGTSAAAVAVPGENVDALPANLVDAFQKQGLRLEAVYEYGPQFKICRCLDAAGRKEIRPICASDGKWRFGVPDGQRPLFNLAALHEADPAEPVFVVEGEKCVMAATAIGLLATTSSGGSGAAAKTDWSVLEGRSVVVLPDRDDAGENYARSVEQQLAPLNCEVRVVRLESVSADGTGPGFDVADLVEEWPETQLAELGSKLRVQAEGSPALRARSRVSIAQDLLGIRQELAKTHGRRLLGLASGCLPTVDVMLDGWRGLGLLAAEPGIGKTTLMLQVGLGVVKSNPDACFVFLSLEMDRDTMLHRIICQESGLGIGTVRKGSQGAQAAKDGLRLTPEDRRKFDGALAELGRLAPRIDVLDMQAMPLGLDVDELATWIARRVREVKARSGCATAFVAIDHLALVPVGLDSAATSMDRDDARVMVALRAQRMLGDPLFVISQLRKTDYAKPGLASAKGSAQIVYAPDVYMTLTRVERADGEGESMITEDPVSGWSLLRLKIEKGRDGVMRADTALRFWVDSHRIEEEH